VQQVVCGGCVCVCVVSRGNYMTAVLRNFYLFHEGLSGYLCNLRR